MYVCICNAVTDSQVRHAAKSGVRDLWGLQSALGVATGCGSCKEMASEILAESRHEDGHSDSQRAQPALYIPSAG